MSKELDILRLTAQLEEDRGKNIDAARNAVPQAKWSDIAAALRMSRTQVVTIHRRWLERDK